MKVRFFDLRVNDEPLIANLIPKIETFLRQGVFLFGPAVSEAELALARWTDSNQSFCLVSSGSSALYLALKALGIGEGDEVITTPHTWVLTANAVIETGARPVFTDVDKNGVIDPNHIVSSITDKTKAILPVHFTGLLCDMRKLRKIADDYKLLIIEDAAQSFGARREGYTTGSLADAAAYSFNPMKGLGVFGELGAVSSREATTIEKVKRLRYGGTYSDPNKIITNELEQPSLNHKPDTIQAVFINELLPMYENRLEVRRKIAKIYDDELRNKFGIQEGHTYTDHAFYCYTIMTEDRDKLNDYLKKNEIETKIYHKPLLTRTSYYRTYKTNELPEAERTADSVLSLPASEKLNASEQEYIISLLRRF